MQIVTDSGADLVLTPEELAKLKIHVVPLVVTLEGRTYYEGVDIEGDAFYQMLIESGSFPTTSQPSVGAFAETYRRIAASDPEILSIHITGTLSGTVESARQGAALVPQADVTVVDTRTLSAAVGWQAEAAARAAQAGWPKGRILELMQQVGQASDALFTLEDVSYLVHGGRVSQMTGLIASVLKIKPLISVNKEKGTLVHRGRTRSFSRAVKGLVDLIARQHAPGSALRVQVMHAHNQEGVDVAQELMDQRFDCTWLPAGPISLVLGAHSGPGMVGIIYAPLDAYPDLPGLE